MDDFERVPAQIITFIIISSSCPCPNCGCILEMVMGLEEAVNAM